MSVLNVPANKNFLSPLGYSFTLARAPNLSFTVQNARVPGMQLGEIFTPTPFVPIPNSNGITFNPLSVTFRVSEDLTDYLEIHNWMIALGAPENFDQFRAIQNVAPGNRATVYSDITLIVLNSSMSPNLKFTFYDAFPVSIGDLDFNTTDTDVNYIQCTADFRYLRYDIETL